MEEEAPAATAPAASEEPATAEPVADDPPPTAAAPSTDGLPAGDALLADEAGLAPAAEAQPVDPAMAQIHMRIANAFRVFDMEDNNTVDVRELGTIIRSLGCCPTEAQLHEIILECEEEDSEKVVKYERVEPVLARTLQQKLFKSESEATIRRAFEVLDKEKKGFLQPEELSKLLMEEGEPFTQDEVEEMMMQAVDDTKKVIYYEEHASAMYLEEEAYGGNVY